MVSALPAQVLVLKSILTAYLCGRTRRYMLLCCPGVTGPFFVELLRSEKALQMDRVRKFTGMAKATPAVVPARRDEDESLALFGELYQHEKERDMNLLEPMFSVEFEAIQGDGLLLLSHYSHVLVGTNQTAPIFPSVIVSILIIRFRSSDASACI